MVNANNDTAPKAAAILIGHPKSVINTPLQTKHAKKIPANVAAKMIKVQVTLVPNSISSGTHTTRKANKKMAKPNLTASIAAFR